jgi:hypothetical protein
LFINLVLIVLQFLLGAFDGVLLYLEEVLDTANDFDIARGIYAIAFPIFSWD